MPLVRHEFTTSWFPGHRNALTKASIGAIVGIVHLRVHSSEAGRPTLTLKFPLGNGLSCNQQYLIQ